MPQLLFLPNFTVSLTWLKFQASWQDNCVNDHVITLIGTVIIVPFICHLFCMSLLAPKWRVKITQVLCHLSSDFNDPEMPSELTAASKFDHLFWCIAADYSTDPLPIFNPTFCTHILPSSMHSSYQNRSLVFSCFYSASTPHCNPFNRSLHYNILFQITYDLYSSVFSPAYHNWELTILGCGLNCLLQSHPWISSHCT